MTAKGVATAVLFGFGLYTQQLMAESKDLLWSGELYGGRYYDDERVGAYFYSSRQNDNGPALVAEALYEYYTDYRFAGLGAHILWETGSFGSVGLLASQAWESYEPVGGAETDYQTQIVGAEWELELEQWAVAIQAGKYLKDYDDEQPAYLSADIYFWSANYDWYLRASTSRTPGESQTLVEAYRVFDLYGRTHMVYAGVSTHDLSLASPGNNDDSAYAGVYAELYSTPDAALYLWLEAAAGSSDTIFTIEVNFSFGTGARAPYISAFGN